VLVALIQTQQQYHEEATLSPSLRTWLAPTAYELPAGRISLSDMAPVTHCLFDMDGLLLDTETFYTVAQQEIVGQYGKEFTWDLKAKMMGKKALESAQILVTELDIADKISAEEFLKLREEKLDELFPTSPLLPGVDKLIRHLHSHGIPIAVATSSHRRHFDMKTSQHEDLFKLFNHVITGDLVTKSKPDPEIFLLCKDRFEAPPADTASCLVFEDAPTGVAAGKAAGMQVVMVPDSQLDKSLIKEADVVLGSMEEFDPAHFGLPPY